MITLVLIIPFDDSQNHLLLDCSLLLHTKATMLTNVVILSVAVAKQSSSHFPNSQLYFHILSSVLSIKLEPLKLLQSCN